MTEGFESSFPVLVIWLAILAILIAIGVYVIARVRSMAKGGDTTGNQWLTKFRDLHSEGGLSDEEYRTIKSVLAQRLQQQLSGAEEPR